MMKLTKIHTSGSDYLICTETALDGALLAKRLLDRCFGIGADGLIMLSEDAGMRLFLPSGKESPFCASAVIAAAKFVYDVKNGEKNIEIKFGELVFTVRFSTLGGRVLCAWLTMPRVIKRPMEELKYYHGVRGEVLRSYIKNPRISVYDLCGAHAVFLLESCAVLRALNMQSVCRRLEEVLFYGEEIDLHFAAIAGDNALAVRSWRCLEGEIGATGEGAALCAYAAAEYELVDSPRVMIKAVGGSFCAELCKDEVSLCAKCETVFEGQAV